MIEVVDAVEKGCWLFLAEMKQCVTAFVEWPWIRPKDEVLVCVKKITMASTDLVPWYHTVFAILIISHAFRAEGHSTVLNFWTKIDI